MLDTLSSIASGLKDFATSLGEFATGLNEQDTWLRVVLVIIGFVLVFAVLLKASGRVA